MSKGGSTSSTVEVPQYIEDAARRNLTQADLISKIGFIPEYGPTVAAFTPSQEAAFQGTAQAASAFGLPGGGMSQQDIMGGMPEPTTYDGGVRGYSSLPIYEQALEAFGQARPGQKEYIDSFFIDPFTGAAGSNMQAPVDYTVAPTPGDLGGISAGGGGDSYSPTVVPPVATAVDVPFTIPPVIQGPYINDTTDGFNDILSSNTPVVTTDELTTRLEEEERLRQEDAVRRADELAARANANPDLVGLDDKIFLQNQLEGGSSINTGSYLPGFSAEETNAAALDPRGSSQIPGSTSTGLFTGGGADGVGNFGKVGDFAAGLLGGLNVTGPYIGGGFESRPAHATDNDREFDAFYDTKIKDPLSGKMLSPFQLSNRLQPGSLGAQYADIGITSLDQILDPTPPPPPQPVSTSAPVSGVSETADMEVRSLPNGTEYFVDASGNFAGLK